MQSWLNDYCAELAAQTGEEYGPDETCWRGVLVSTADTAFVIMPDKLSKEPMMWSDTFGYGLEIPYCANFNPDDMEVADGEDPWDVARDKARLDFDGYMNTAKILKHCTSPIAAKCAAAFYADWGDQHNFLPSCGQLYVMWLNRTAINAIMEAANADGWEFRLLPYQNEKNQWVYPNDGFSDNWWWSSTQAGPNCSWVVGSYGGTLNYLSYYTNDVRAVSAFHFEY